MSVHRVTWALLETTDVPTSLPGRIALAAFGLTPAQPDSCTVCSAAVGYVLTSVEHRTGDEDERLQWRTVAILDDGEQTWLLCEDCTLPLSPSLVTV